MSERDRRWPLTAALLAGLLLATSSAVLVRCATVTGDPFVVDAERALSAGDVLLAGYVEWVNRQAEPAKIFAAHAEAVDVYDRAYKALQASLDAYKAVRTPEARARLLRDQETLSRAMAGVPQVKR